MAAHAKFSPSAMYRRINCPGSWGAEHGKISVSSAAAIEGDIGHGLAEHCITEGDKATDYIDKEYSSDRGTMTITEEMALAVQLYVDYVTQASVRASLTGCEIWLQMPGHPDFWGTADFVYAEDFGTLEVIDLKLGTGILVKALENPQIAAYMLGALRWARDHNITVLRLRGTIVQPRIHGFEGEDCWEIDDIEAFESHWTKVFSDTIVACLSKEPERAAGDHCGFCTAKLECPELKDNLLLKAIDEFDDAPVESIKKGDVEKVVASAELEELVRIHSHAGIVRKFLDEAAKHLKALAERGETIPGHKLVRSVGNRAWNLPEEEMIKKFRNKNLKQADFYDRKLKGPAKIEKIIEDEKFFEKFVTRPDKGLILVANKDKREAVEILPALEEFNDAD